MRVEIQFQQKISRVSKAIENYEFVVKAFYIPLFVHHHFQCLVGCFSLFLLLLCQLPFQPQTQPIPNNSKFHNLITQDSAAIKTANKNSFSWRYLSQLCELKAEWVRVTKSNNQRKNKHKRHFRNMNGRIQKKKKTMMKLHEKNVQIYGKHFCVQMCMGCGLKCGKRWE